MPKLTLLVGRTALKVYNLNTTVMRIGREADMDVVIDNVAVSRQQAEIRREDNDWILRDLGSGNGTFLNGERVEGGAPLKAGDEISFGKFSLFFDHVPAAPVAEAPASRAIGLQSSGTLLLKPDEAAELQKAVAQQRRAQVRWKVGVRDGTYFLAGTATLVGRTTLCDLRVPIRWPSQHVLVTRNGSAFEIRNLSRWHRMLVNGKAKSRATLASGDQIAVGALRLTFLDEVH